MDVRDQYFSISNLKELFDVAVDTIFNFIREAGLRLAFKNIFIYSLCYVNEVL